MRGRTRPTPPPGRRGSAAPSTRAPTSRRCLSGASWTSPSPTRSIRLYPMAPRMLRRTMAHGPQPGRISSCQTQAGDLPVHKVHGGGTSQLRGPCCQLSRHHSCSHPQGSATGSPEEESQKGTMEPCHMSPLPLLSAHPAERGYHVRGVFYGWNPTHSHLLPGPPSYLPVEDVNHSDCWLHVRLYYCDMLVKEVTTRTAEGCRITSRAVPADSERLYGPSCMEQIEFPPPRALSGSGRVASMTDVLERLLPHLERGVLLWVAPEGVFMKRQCQGRVYWNGPLAPHRDWPNKLEREKTYKLLDTQQFLQQLRGYLSHGQPMPQYQIHLCFGEEYPTSAGHHFQKLIMAHVEPVFARELFHHAQRMGPMLLRDSPQPCSPGASSHIIHVLKQLCQP
ncbi:interferon regulatory factor 4-like isoform X2 [Phalacrocorax aristotelis]|uniref:interferon regulatory factor 4-like isoform X2 n=1 Tax=Phalacrocorax aristotelis TaxID=126867 RepID=UPI003F4C0898